MLAKFKLIIKLELISVASDTLYLMLLQSMPKLTDLTLEAGCDSDLNALQHFTGWIMNRREGCNSGLG